MDISLLGIKGIREVYNLHPMFVHFPLALFPSAFLLYLIGTIWKRRECSAAGRACLYLGVAGSLLALLTGLQAAGSIPHNDTIHRMMQTHETLGWVLVALGIVAGGWSFWQKDHQPKAGWWFLGLMVIINLVLIQGGDLGSRMVYVEGAAVKPAVSVITSGHEHEGHEHQGEHFHSGSDESATTDEEEGHSGHDHSSDDGHGGGHQEEH